MLTKTVGVAIQNDRSSTKMTPVVVQNGYADDAELWNIEERFKNMIDGTVTYRYGDIQSLLVKSLRIMTHN
jgi:hypothetical protein